MGPNASLLGTSCHTSIMSRGCTCTSKLAHTKETADRLLPYGPHTVVGQGLLNNLLCIKKNNVVENTSHTVTDLLQTWHAWCIKMYVIVHLVYSGIVSLNFKLKVFLPGLLSLPAQQLCISLSHYLPTGKVLGPNQLCWPC